MLLWFVPLPSFPESQNGAEYSLSRIPYSWRVLHLLLCFTGVNNVFFITSLPRWLRVASLVYNTVWFCLSVPLVVMFIHSVKWGRSVNNIIQHVGMIICNSYLITLGTAHTINSLNTNRAVTFLKKWCSFCSDESIYHEEETSKRYRKVWVALVIVNIAIITWYLITVARHFALIVDWSMCGSTLFSSLNTSHWFLKAVCVNYYILHSVSLFSVILTACLFAIVSLTLAEEFDKLYRVICNHVACPSTDISVWEQMRFRHEALVSLVCLHGQLFSMLLGLILVGNIVIMCFGLYHVFTMQTGVLGMLSIFIVTVVFSTIIVPSNELENEVSEILI